MYHNRSRYRSSGGGFGSYLMPFLIIICVGVIIILLFNLVKSFFGSPVTQKAYLHILDGNVSMKTWGTDQFFDVSADVLIVEGDELKTSADSRVIVEFFDGTIMRIAGGSDVIFDTIDDGDGELKLLLVDGMVWFNKHYKNTTTEVVVDTGDVLVTSVDSGNFEVENEIDDALRTIVGADVRFEVIGDGGKAVAEDEVGPGQEAVFTSDVLARFRQFQSPNVVVGRNDVFESTEWYKWNIDEDKTPTAFVMMDGGWEFVKADPEVMGPESVAVVDGEEVFEPEVVTDAVAAVSVDGYVEPVEPVEPVGVLENLNLGEVGVPVLVSVSGGTQTNSNGFYVITGNPGVIYGSVSGAAKVVVNGYTLTKFNPGDTEWTYFANADYDFMREGENTYEIYAIGGDGLKSQGLTVKVLYQPVKVVPVVEVVPALDTSASDLAKDEDSSLEFEPAPPEEL